jgi:DNA-binding transcriptional MerR regulator
MDVCDSYSSSQVRRILRVSQRRLDYWDELGLVSPVRANKGSKKRGRGDRRCYTFNDLIKLKVLKDLRETGLSLQRIQKGLKVLRKRSLHTDPFDEVLLTDGKSFHRVRANGKIEDLLSNRQLVFGVMSLRELELDIRNRICRMPTDSRKRGVKSA